LRENLADSTGKKIRNLYQKRLDGPIACHVLVQKSRFLKVFSLKSAKFSRNRSIHIVRVFRVEGLGVTCEDLGFTKYFYRSAKFWFVQASEISASNAPDPQDEKYLPHMTGGLTISHAVTNFRLAIRGWRGVQGVGWRLEGVGCRV